MLLGFFVLPPFILGYNPAMYVTLIMDIPLET
jgi:hypothetical protein